MCFTEKVRCADRVTDSETVADPDWPYKSLVTARVDLGRFV
jgi:hypothetical protein